jgi:hypothetical protein
MRDFETANSAHIMVKKGAQIAFRGSTLDSPLSAPEAF